MATIWRFARLGWRRSSRNAFDLLNARPGDLKIRHRRVAAGLIIALGLSGLATGYQALAASLPGGGAEPEAEAVQVWPGQTRGRAFSVKVPMVTVDNPPIISASTLEAPAGTVTIEQQGRANLVRGLLSGRPLAPYALQMVQAADANGVDWRLMPVISILESGGGAAACGGNAWGFAACRVTFGSFEEGIARVAALLGSSPYAGQSPEVVLCIWVSGGNCGSVQAYNYVQRASWLFAQLGGQLQVGAAPEQQAGAATPEPVATPTPAATTAPDPTVPPTATPTADATAPSPPATAAVATATAASPSGTSSGAGAATPTVAVTGTAAAP
jgi:hypothetical protein